MWLYSPLLPRIFDGRVDAAGSNDRTAMYSDKGCEEDERVDLLRESGSEHERSTSAKRNDLDKSSSNFTK